MAQNRLKEVLIAEGLTQGELAGVASVSVGTINKLINEKRTVAPRTMHRLLNGLNSLTARPNGTKRVYDFKDLFPHEKDGKIEP